MTQRLEIEVGIVCSLKIEERAQSDICYGNCVTWPSEKESLLHICKYCKLVIK